MSSSVENKLYRLSPAQLKALNLLSKSTKAVISSTASSLKIGKKGKALGGIFSSLSRQVISGEHLVIPWGKAENGRGLRWKLNIKLISQEKLLEITNQLLD